MARHRGHRGSRPDTLRDLSTPPTRSLTHQVALDPGLPAFSFRGPFDLTEIEDRRLYYPDPVLEPPPRSPGRSRIPIIDQPPNRNPTSVPYRSVYRSNFAPAVHQSFQHPMTVAICVRRNQRKQVLHALKKVGRGGSKARPRRNAFSNIRC